MFQQANNNSSDMKRGMFLDLGGENDNSKQKQFQNLLGSQMLLGSTPTPTQFTFPKYVTDEQEAYARGFVEALAELHTGPNGMPVAAGSDNDSTSNQATYSTLTPMTSVFGNMTQSNPMQSGYQSNPAISRRHPPFVPSGLAVAQTQYSTMNSSYSPKVKSEPSSAQSDRAKSPLSDDNSDSQTESQDSFRENSNRLDAIPLDLNEQERLKLERKRAKNRIAARKCRTRKLETISRLEEKVEGLKSRNQELSQTTNCLQEQLRLLKQQIMEHMKSGCAIGMPDLRHNMNMVQAPIH